MKYSKLDAATLDKVGSISQLAGIRHYEFASGKAKGVEAFEIHTGGGLSFTVLPGRGMDIAWTEYKGVPVNYMSKTGIVSPGYYESSGMDALHNFFGGTLTTCGLLNVGGPQKVTHPVIGALEYGLHGRISNCAAEQVSCFEDYEDGEYIMRVSGVMREGILHGESLTLRREITAKFGEKEFKLKDTVKNHNAFAQDIMLLYHINMGYPLLDSGSRLLAAVCGTSGADSAAEAEKDRAFCFEAPTAGIGERCFRHDMKADADGNVCVAFVNDGLELGVELRYNKNELPNFNEWKMLNKKEYVVGLEPGISLPVGINSAKEHGSVQTLQPGETKTVEITYRILDGAEEIRECEKRICGHAE